MMRLARLSWCAALLLAGGTVGVTAQQGRTPTNEGQGRPSPAARVLPVQGNVSLITSSAGNITVQVGKNGPVLVDTPAESDVPQFLNDVRGLSPLPIRYIINTSIMADRTGGNAALVGPSAVRGTGGAPFGFAGLNRPNIIAHENVLNRMSAATPAVAPAMLPTTEYFQASLDLFTNGEAIVVFHTPAALTDGDSIVFFRRSDVISTGDLFTPGRYPVIDLQRGGTVQGLVAGLGRILELAVPEAFESGGTLIVPGRGRVSEETDVAEFRDMLAIIRDRVQDGIAKKQTLEQVKASKPSRDYDAEYGASPADADRLVESIYRSMMATRAAAPAPRGGRS